GMVFGIAAGLYAGTKYVALVYLPILLLIVVAHGLRRRALWAIPGVVVFAAPWYLRNWIVAGSPIYPASVQIAGFTVASGAFTRAAMLNTVFHTSDITLVPTLAARAFGPTLFVVWLPVALIGSLTLARRGWWPHGFLALTPALMALLYWFGFPVNVDPRFFMAAIAPALLPFAFTFRDDGRWDRAVHIAYAIAIAWIVIGSTVRFEPAGPWYVRDWWAFTGLVSTRFVGWFLAIAVAAAAAWRFAPDLRGAVAAASAIVGLSSAALAGAAGAWCAAARCEYLQVTSPHIPAAIVDAWDWTADNVRHATVAYTGINLPYPLTGSQLTNRVVYVNTDSHVRWRFHDYDRAYRAGRFTPVGPPLASSSGELMPIAA